MSFKYGFHVDTERMLKCEKCKEISATMIRKMCCQILLRLGRIANICRLQSTQLICVGYGQLNSTTALDALHQACMTLAIQICSIWTQGIFSSF